MSLETRSIDRAALVRRAMVELVAERGIHGTSMSGVAQRAGVATGTAYVHYESKDELLIAAFVEVKRALGEAGLESIEDRAEAMAPRDLFETVWRGIHRHLQANPEVAKFLIQVEGSPLRKRAHDSLPEDDPLTATAGSLAAELVELPVDVLYDLSLAPAVRLVASGIALSEEELSVVVESCWRAVSSSS